MIFNNNNLACNEAVLYYYDFLNKDIRQTIPQYAAEHIAQCPHCISEIEQLRTTLKQADRADANEQNWKDSIITSMLELQLGYVDKPVTCNTTKVFLASLANPLLEIKIPTPITQHIEECSDCADDLSAICELNLTSKQLLCLNQFLPGTAPKDDITCSEAQKDISFVASMSLGNTNARVLKHFSTCVDCRELLYQHRERIRALLMNSINDENEYPCYEVKASDMFDYCFPYGIDPANDQYAMFRSAFTSHLLTCHDCLTKMQQLYATICNIAERPESTVVTLVTSDQQFKGFADTERDILSDAPLVDSEQAYTNEFKSHTLPVPRQLKRKVTFARLAAAAVILIAVSIFFVTPAKAVKLNIIYKALEQIRNICISRVRPGQTEPWQRVWISRTNNLRLNKTGDKIILFDINNKTRKIKDPGVDTLRITTMSEKLLTKAIASNTGSLGLMPFPTITDVPENALWNRVDDKNIEAAIPYTEVYDLTWTDTKGQTTEYHRWRVFVDTNTNLPKKVEYYNKFAIDTEYILRSVLLVDYLSSSEIETIVQTFFNK
ncbi:hypothetical protein ACFL3G_11520 [Planctomycetota bacterium]